MVSSKLVPDANAYKTFVQLDNDDIDAVERLSLSQTKSADLKYFTDKCESLDGFVKALFGMWGA